MGIDGRRSPLLPKDEHRNQVRPVAQSQADEPCAHQRRRGTHKESINNIDGARGSGGIAGEFYENEKHRRCAPLRSRSTSVVTELFGSVRNSSLLRTRADTVGHGRTQREEMSASERTREPDCTLTADTQWNITQLEERREEAKARAFPPGTASARAPS